jgi:putative inorganic carbon (hco3(-)) transporter
VITETNKLKWFYFISIGFLCLCIFGFLTRDDFSMHVLPIFIIGMYLLLVRADVLLLLAAFLTPLAVNISMGAMGLSLPTEPIFIGLMLLYLAKFFFSGYDRQLYKHPVAIAILVNLLWIFITCITSDMRVVSIKFFIARLWFTTSLFFLAAELFKKFANIKRFILLYVAGLTIVVLYTIFRHVYYGLTEQAAHWVSTPFFNDHTAYAAALALYLPVLACFIKLPSLKPSYRILCLLLFLFLSAATILSYTRAAWVSLAFALAVYVIIRLRIKFRTLVLFGLLGGMLFFGFKDQLIMKLEKNQQDSSSDYAAHLKSIANISTDASNLERINRWKSAFRMFLQRPVFGWGPGTYMFEYAPFQKPNEKTIISTNMATGGNAHSEYIGPLAESGVLGTVTFLVIIIVVSYRSLKIITTTRDKEIRLIVMGLFLGLCTYFIHGFLNNFLDTDKASVPFWGFIAMITAIDLHHRDRSELAPADK